MSRRALYRVLIFAFCAVSRTACTHESLPLSLAAPVASVSTHGRTGQCAACSADSGSQLRQVQYLRGGSTHDNIFGSPGAQQMEDPGDDEHQNIGRAAHETNNQYHDLMAKRARLMREVDIATVRGLEIARKIERDQTALSTKQQDLVLARMVAEDKAAVARKKEAEAAAAAAAAAASVNDAAAAGAAASELEDTLIMTRAELTKLEMEMKSVLVEEKESNERLKICMDEFQVLLLNAKNAASTPPGGSGMSSPLFSPKNRKARFP